MDPLLASGVSGACQNPPALVNDCLHWIPHENLGNQLVVFDTRVEMFRWMNAPAVPDPRKGSSSSQLAHMDSKLIFASINTTGVEVWSVACYASAEWVWLYQLQLPLSEIDHFRGDETPTVQVLPLERQVLVQCTHNILLCDNTGVLKNFELPGHRVVMLPHVLKESLLQRSFLHLQEKDAAYLDPPFFHPLWD
uniref:F-box associated domain-containing protein n=1 Tax=Arundo donax TaxID=35708 RepID=A0A0A9HP87_ARUDO